MNVEVCGHMFLTINRQHYGEATPSVWSYKLWYIWNWFLLDTSGMQTGCSIKYQNLWHK